ncbi:hypothetical protein [Roseomonas rosulenta]|uniref:hypothetical protein n=1 Tax=Roseomonas rosulenta TaxID=2748667 RepID=UPI0018DEFDEF|nr:hypothetical protein [Roseomonas rosulenta]
MNQVVTSLFLSTGAKATRSLSEVTTDPISAATAAVERCLAQAHEAGNEDAVRLLHAVSAILSSSPRARLPAEAFQPVV